MRPGWNWEADTRATGYLQAREGCVKRVKREREKRKYRRENWDWKL